MVRVNNVEIPIKDSDTIDIFKKRVAVGLDTIEKYLIFPEEMENMSYVRNNEDISVIDIINRVKITKSFSELYNKIKEESKDISVKNIYELYIIFNDIITTNFSRVKNISLLVSLLEVEKIKIEEELSLTIDVDIENLWKNRKFIIKEYTSELDKNISFLKSFDTLKSEMIKTEFSVDRKIIDVKITRNNETISSLFNGSNVNNTIPIIIYNDYYKVLSNYKFSNEDIEGKDEEESDIQDKKINDILILKKIKKNKSKQFDDILVKVEEDFIIINFDLFTREDTIEEQINVVLETINIKSERIIEMNEKIITGEFLIAKQTLNKYVFSDLIFMNEIFNSFGINTLETQYVTIKKANYYLYFDIPGLSLIKANLTEKEMEPKTWSTIPEVLRKDFRIGEKYILVKILSSRNLEEVEIFNNILGKVFYIYNQEYDNIVKEYRKYIPDFAKEKGKKLVKKKTVKSQKLTKIEPDIFVKKYSVKCEKKRQPDAYTDEEFLEKYPDGLDEEYVVKFPKDSELKEGKIKRNYVCLEKGEYKYPGFQKNTLPNKEDYSYLPCCFKTPQLDKSKIYFENIKTTGRVIQQRMITTDKILDNDIEGNIPEELIKLFEIVNTDIKYQFIRKGVYKTTNSFINCIMEVKGLTTRDGIIIPEEQLLDIISGYRMKFLEDKYVSLCKQQLYDITINDIKKIINDERIYFDPKIFKHIIEEEFNVNVFIFSRTDVKNVDLVLPRFKDFYINFFNKYPSVIIYEHQEHCELLLKVNKKDKTDVKYSFEFDDVISKELRKLLNTNHQFYNFNKRVNNPYISKELGRILLSQNVDNSGKTRAIKTEYDGQIITILTTPLPQFSIPTEDIPLKDFIKSYPTLTSVMSFVKTLKIGNEDIIKNINYGNEIIDITFVVGNVKMSIPVNNVKDINETLTLKSNIKTTKIGNVSYLEEFKKMKRVSKFVKQYFVILYSNYCKDKNLNKYEIGFEINIKDFIENYVEIVPEFEYEIPDYIININNTTLIREGKIIIKSIETLKRLTFFLRREIIQNEDKVFNSYKQKYLQDYYSDINDFDIKSNQIIINSEKTLNKWINGMNLSNEITSCPNSLNKKFFYNEKLDKNIYFIQEVNNLYEFLGNSKIWLKEGVNETKSNVIVRKGIKMIKENKDKFIIVASDSNCNNIVLRLANSDSKDKISPSKLYVIKDKKEDSDDFTVKYYSLLSL